jgi:hypothetical protein
VASVIAAAPHVGQLSVSAFIVSVSGLIPQKAIRPWADEDYH